MDNGCWDDCMNNCTKQYSTNVCNKYCNKACASGVDVYKKPSNQLPSSLYGAPSIQEALQASAPAFIKKV